MNKVQLSSAPSVFQTLPSGKIRVYLSTECTTMVINHFDEETHEALEDEEIDCFMCDYIDIAPEQFNYSALIEALIRDRYSVSDELAILRQRDEKPEEFAVYNSFAEQAKFVARHIFMEVENG